MTNSVLLIAYTIDPKGGSEPKIAWNNFVITQSLNIHAHIVTSQICLDSFQDFSKTSDFSGFTIHRVDTPKILGYMPTILGDYLKYVIWLRLAKKTVNKIVCSHEITLGHHVSLGNLALGSPLCDSKIPYIFGPAGGGTKRIASDFTAHDLTFQVIEFARSMMMRAIRLSPFSIRSLKNASIVLATNEDSYDYAIKAGARNVTHFLADSIETELILPFRQYSETNHVLWAGRFLRRKAPLDAIEAFKNVKSRVPDMTMTMVGNGPLFKKVAKEIEKNNLTDSVFLLDRVIWSELLDLMTISKCLLFTSHRDSFGSQILEAAARGTPSVTHSGIAALEWINKSSVFFQSSKNKLGEMADLTESLFTCMALNEEQWLSSSKAALDFAKRHSSSIKRQELMKHYQELSVNIAK